jgi:hypothetical protein
MKIEDSKNRLRGIPHEDWGDVSPQRAAIRSLALPLTSTVERLDSPAPLTSMKIEDSKNRLRGIPHEDWGDVSPQRAAIRSLALLP